MWDLLKQGLSFHKKKRSHICVSMVLCKVRATHTLTEVPVG